MQNGQPEEGNQASTSRDEAQPGRPRRWKHLSCGKPGSSTISCTDSSKTSYQNTRVVLGAGADRRHDVSLDVPELVSACAGDLSCEPGAHTPPTPPTPRPCLSPDCRLEVTPACLLDARCLRMPRQPRRQTTPTSTLPAPRWRPTELPDALSRLS